MAQRKSREEVAHATTRAAAPRARGGARAPGAAHHALVDHQLTRLLGYNLSRADIRMRKYFLHHMDDYGLRPAEFSALVLIAANPRLNQKRLGTALDVSAPNLAVLLDKLTGRGLLLRVRSSEDRRAQHLHLTPKGEALLARAEASVARVEQAVFEILTPGERALLIELLRKVALAPAP